MAEFNPNKGSERLDVNLPEPDTYAARLVSIVHQGTVEGIYGPQTQAVFRFELPTETAVFKEGGEELPHTVNVYITVSASPRGAFLQVMEKLGIDTSGPFKVEDALGKTCSLTVSHKEGKDYLIASWKDIAKLMKGTKVPEQVNESKLFWFTADYDSGPILDSKGNPVLDESGKQQYEKKSCSNVIMEGYDNLNEWEREKIEKSWEYKAYIEEKNNEKIDENSSEERF